MRKDPYMIQYIENPIKEFLMVSLLKILKNGDIDYVEELLNKYSNRNYPEIAIIRQSIENDK